MRLVAGACSAAEFVSAEFVVEWAEEEYDAPESEPNQKSRLECGAARFVLITLVDWRSFGSGMKSLIYSARYRRYRPFMPASTENKK
jgi:hypothetical protein